jgi:hypothetical protein
MTAVPRFRESPIEPGLPPPVAARGASFEHARDNPRTCCSIVKYKSELTPRSFRELIELAYRALPVKDPKSLRVLPRNLSGSCLEWAALMEKRRASCKNDRACARPEMG